MKQKLILYCVFQILIISINCQQPRGLLATFPTSVILGEQGELCVRFFNLNSDIQLVIDDDEPHAFERINKTVPSSEESCLSIKIIDDPKLAENYTKEIRLYAESTDGSYRFIDTKQYKLIKPSLLTFVETDKPVYKPLDTIQLRILTLGHNLKAVPNNFKLIYIQDSSLTRVYQWSNIQSSNGLIQLKLPLSDEPNFGIWKVTVEGYDEDSETSVSFEVKKYVLPKFELQIKAPESVPNDLNELTINACAKYSYGKDVKGKIHSEIVYNWTRYYYDVKNPPNNFTLRFTNPLKGCETLKFNLNGILREGRRYYNEKIYVNAKFIEDGTGQEANASSEIQIIYQKYKAELLEPKYYKPGLPSKIRILVKNYDDSPAKNITIVLKNDITYKLTTNDNGIAEFTKILVPACVQKPCVRAKSIRFRVSIPPSDETIASFNLQPWYSKTNSYIQIYEKNANLNDNYCKNRINLIIRKQTSKHIQQNIYFEVTSRSKISLSGYIDEREGDVKLTFNKNSNNIVFLEKLKSKREIKLFEENNEIEGDYLLSIPVLNDDSNEVKILVFFIVENEVIPDSIVIKTKKCLANEVNLSLDKDEVRTKENVKLTIQSAPKSLCALSAVDKSVSFLGKLNRLNIDQVFDAISKFNLVYDSFNTYKYTDKCGPNDWYPRGKRLVMPDYYPYHDNYAYSAVEAFKDSGLIHFTDLEVYNQARCIMARMMAFSDESFITSAKRPAPMAMQLDTDLDLRSETIDTTASDQPKTVETIRSFFPETWLWQLEELDEVSGVKEISLTSPDSITDWLFDSYCLSNTKGLGISQQQSLRVFQPFFVSMNLPYSVVQDEIFPIKVSIVSYLDKCVPINVRMGGEKNFELKSSAQFIHCLCPDVRINQEFRIKANTFDEKGLNLSATAQIILNSDVCSSKENIDILYSDTEIRSLVVYAPGVTKEQTKSSLIVLSGEDNYFSDTFNFSYPENVIGRTVRVHISVIGDIMGPALDNLDSLVQLPTGCGEQNMVNFAPLISTSNYLKATNRFEGSLKSKIIDYVTTGYQRELKYRHTDGSYSAFGENDKEGGGTWLSAFVLKCFAQASSSGIISIDKLDMEVTLKWLLGIQAKDGSFPQVGAKLHSKGLSGGLDSDKAVGLSAYVMSSLFTARNQANITVEEGKIEDGLAFLRRSLIDLSIYDTYSLALVFYTFNLANRNQNFAQDIEAELDRRANKDAAFTYWTSLKQEQTPYYTQPSSADIEVTAYILLAKLLTLTAQNEDTKIPELVNIVKWLSSKQTSLGGFYSTQDTVIALEALSKFATRFYTDTVNLNMEWTTNLQSPKTTRIYSKNRLLLQKFKLFPRRKNNNIISYNLTGTGNALVQVHVKYNVQEDQADETKYQLNLSTNLIDCKNGILKLAIQPLLLDTSSMTITSMRLPSGWIPSEGSLQQIQNLKRSDVNGGEITLYFDNNQLPEDGLNFDINIQKEFEVQNSQPGFVNVYDYYEPNRGSVLKQFEIDNSTC